MEYYTYFLLSLVYSTFPSIHFTALRGSFFPKLPLHLPQLLHFHLVCFFTLFLLLSERIYPGLPFLELFEQQLFALLDFPDTSPSVIQCFFVLCRFCVFLLFFL